MADEKVYTPEVVAALPFPDEASPVGESTGIGGSNETYQQPTTQSNPIPRRLVAIEVIGSALNTKAGKILKEFQFTEMGALQIGKYQNGISGDLRFTPAGFVGRNTSGDTTIAFDVETGSAIFAGELRSGTLITGDIIVGNNTWIISGDPDRPSIKLFNNGVCEILIGEP